MQVQIRNILKSFSINNSFIFLSHSSKDKSYGNVLRTLMLSLGIPNSNLIYTSHLLNKIPAGENIYEYLSKRIKKSNIVLFLLSDNYFNSSACLNEMGASWIIKNDYYSFFVPGFDYRSKKFNNSCIDKNKMAITLNGDLLCRKGLLEFAKTLVKTNNIEIEQEILYDAVETACRQLRKFTAVNQTYTSAITEIKERADYIFCKLDILLPTGENFYENETHWLQLHREFEPIAKNIKQGTRIKFKVKEIKNFTPKKYGTANFRNIYAQPDSIQTL